MYKILFTSQGTVSRKILNLDSRSLLMEKISESENKELEKIKRLLILQMYHQGIPPLEIAKAAGISPNDIYKFVSKKKK